MYNQTYDDYMRNVLGYSNLDGYRMNSMNNMGMNTMGTMNTMGMNSMNMNNMGMNTMNMNTMNTQDMSCEDIERLYPEVHRIVFPIVCTFCDRIQVNSPVTDEMVTRMTDEIYDRVESDPRISINLTVQVRESDNNKDSSETRQRRPRNPFLRDLIRILFLRELFRRRRFPGMGRPPFPMRPF